MIIYQMKACWLMFPLTQYGTHKQGKSSGEAGLLSCLIPPVIFSVDQNTIQALDKVYVQLLCLWQASEECESNFFE